MVRLQHGKGTTYEHLTLDLGKEKRRERRRREKKVGRFTSSNCQVKATFWSTCNMQRTILITELTNRWRDCPVGSAQGWTFWTNGHKYSPASVWEAFSRSYYLRRPEGGSGWSLHFIIILIFFGCPHPDDSQIVAYVDQFLEISKSAGAFFFFVCALYRLIWIWDNGLHLGLGNWLVASVKASRNQCWCGSCFW